MTTAAGRLWRRAPLWRLVLTAALAFGVLTALYPTGLPAWRLPPSIHLPRWLHLPSAAPQAATQAPDTTLVAGAPSDVPPLHGSVSVGGRVVPLPVGDWHEIEVARDEEAAEISDVVLARWQKGMLTGLLSVLASTGPAAGGQPAQVSVEECNDSTNYAVKWADAGHTCWLIRKVAILPPDAMGKPQTTDQVAIAHLRALGISFPAWLSGTLWSHANEGEVMTYKLLVTNGRNANDPSTALATLQGWMTRFAPLLRRGYDGTFDANAAKTVTRDPGAGPR